MKVMPLVIGALGETPKLLSDRLKDIGVEIRIADLQKIAYCRQSEKEE